MRMRSLFPYLAILLPLPLITWFMLSHLTTMTWERVRENNDILVGYALMRDNQYREALAVWLPYAEKGRPEIQMMVSNLYAKGLGKVDKSPEQARYWRDKAAEQGEKMAMYEVGMAYIRGVEVEKDIQAGLDWLRRSAEAGANKARLKYALMHYKGRIVPVDYKVAYHWFSKLADEGHASGTSALGMMVLQGHGTPSDPERAIALFEKAGKGGSREAFENLGAIYYDGLYGITRSHWRAFGYFKRAAEKKSARGLYMTGLMLQAGQGVDRDWDAGWVYLEQAARLGHVKAKEMLLRMEGMSQQP